MMWRRSTERELCASARMLPSHYLAVKAAMLREAAQRGVLPRSEARTMSRLDASRALKVCIASCMATMNHALHMYVHVCAGWQMGFQALSFRLQCCGSCHCAGIRPTGCLWLDDRQQCISILSSSAPGRWAAWVQQCSCCEV